MSIRRTFLRCAATAAFREVLRTERVSVEAKLAVLELTGMMIAPFITVLSGVAIIWWLFTGKRLPGLLGRLVGSPTSWFVNPGPKQLRQLPPDMRTAMAERATADGSW